MSRMTYLFWCGLAEEKWSRSVLWRLADLRLLPKIETTLGDVMVRSHTFKFIPP